MCHSIDKTNLYMTQVSGQVTQSDARLTGRGFDPRVQPFVEHSKSGHEGREY